MSLNGVLTNERVLAAEAGVLTLTDGGAGGNATISISANGVTFAKIEQVPTSTILGRVTAGAGNVEELTGTQATTLLDVFTTLLKGLAPASGGGTANYLRADGTWAAPPGTTPAAPPDATYVTLSTNATLTNERTLAGEATVISITDGGAGNPVTVGISANGVTYAKIQDVSATSRFLGRITGGAGDIEELTGTQATTLLDNFTAALKGLVPLSGGGTANYLRADGSWNAPPGLPTDLTYTAGTRTLNSSTGADVVLPLFTSTEAGLTPLSGGGSTNYLRADGTWAAPPGLPTDLTYTAGTRTLNSSTGADVVLPLFTSTEAGLTPLSGGGSTNYLRADGTWAAPPGTGGVPDGDKGDITVSSSGTVWTIDAGVVTLAKMADLATARFIGRATAGTGVPEALTGTQATSLLDNFTDTLDGLAPLSGGGTDNYLRADGTWTVPPGSGASIAAGWSFNTSTSAADPGSKRFSANNATMASITALYFNDTTQGNVDAGTLLGFLVSGNRIYIQQNNDGTRAALYQVTGAATDNGGWWTVPVSVVASGTLYQNNQTCGAVFILQVSGSSSQAAIQFKDEGSNLGATGTVDTVDFVGAGVTASRVSNTVTVTIAGGGGSGITLGAAIMLPANLV
jgi:hypothetical protein